MSLDGLSRRQSGQAEAEELINRNTVRNRENGEVDLPSPEQISMFALPKSVLTLRKCDNLKMIGVHLQEEVFFQSGGLTSKEW